MSEGKQKLNIRVAPIATTAPTSTIFSLPLHDENTRGSNLPLENKTAPIYGCLVFAIIFMVVISNIDYAVIPKEARLPGIEIEYQRIFILFVWNGIALSSHYFDFQLIIGKEEANSGRNLIYQYLIFLFMYNSILIGMQTLRDNEHIPPEMSDFAIGGIAANTGIFSVQLFIWIRLPKSKTSDTRFRKRFLWFILYRFIQIVFVQLYNQSALLFDKVRNHFQPVLVLLLLGMRYIMTKCWGKTVEKAKEDKNLSAGLAVSCRVGCVHAMFLMLVIGSKATLATTIIYAILDIGLIIIMFFKIIKNVEINQNQGNLNMQTTLQKLVLRETLEILLPFSFSVVKILSFYGPNKDTAPLVRNVTEVDLYVTFAKVFAFLLFDMTRILVLATILKKFYRISMFGSYCKLMKDYWKVIASYSTLTIYIVSIHFDLSI